MYGTYVQNMCKLHANCMFVRIVKFSWNSHIICIWFGYFSNSLHIICWSLQPNSAWKRYRMISMCSNTRVYWHWCFRLQSRTFLFVDLLNSNYKQALLLSKTLQFPRTKTHWMSNLLSGHGPLTLTYGLDMQKKTTNRNRKE